eukprot:751839-Hanusia_phi.AAC.4
MHWKVISSLSERRFVNSLLLPVVSQGVQVEEWEVCPEVLKVCPGPLSTCNEEWSSHRRYHRSHTSLRIDTLANASPGAADQLRSRLREYAAARCFFWRDVSMMMIVVITKG